jgi:hypothetical protein
MNVKMNVVVATFLAACQPHGGELRPGEPGIPTSSETGKPSDGMDSSGPIADSTATDGGTATASTGPSDSITDGGTEAMTSGSTGGTSTDTVGDSSSIGSPSSGEPQGGTGGVCELPPGDCTACLEQECQPQLGAYCTPEQCGECQALLDCVNTGGLQWVAHCNGPASPDPLWFCAANECGAECWA